MCARLFASQVEGIHCVPSFLFLLFGFFSRGLTYLSPIYLPVCASALSPPFPHFPFDPSASRSSIAIKRRERVYWHLKKTITIRKEERKVTSCNVLNERLKGTERGGAIPQIHHQLDIYTFAKLTRSLTRRSINKRASE